MSPRAKQVLLPLLALLLCCAVAAVLVILRRPPPEKTPPDTAPFVSTEVVELGPVQLFARSQGIVAPRFTTQLTAQVAGEITQVADVFVTGGLVKAGDLLAQIDPFNYEVRVQQAEAQLASARATFILERAQGRVAEAEWQRITDATPSDLGLRKPQQEQALAAVKAAQAALDQARKDLERTRILAPFDAVISARHISPGAYVNEGAALGEVLDITVAEVRLPLPQAELAFLKSNPLGTAVVLKGRAAGAEYQWQGRIVRDEGVIDATNRMLYLVAEIADPYAVQRQGPRLPFGTFVEAEIEGPSLASAAVIPAAAVKPQGVPTVTDSGTLHFKTVEIARNRAGQAVVSAGLQQSDRIVTSVIPTPVEGMRLRFEAVNPQDVASHSGTDRHDG